MRFFLDSAGRHIAIAISNHVISRFQERIFPTIRQENPVLESALIQDIANCKEIPYDKIVQFQKKQLKRGYGYTSVFLSRSHSHFYVMTPGDDCLVCKTVLMMSASKRNNYFCEVVDCGEKNHYAEIAGFKKNKEMDDNYFALTGKPSPKKRNLKSLLRNVRFEMSM